jgi:hypothetical protein
MTPPDSSTPTFTFRDWRLSFQGIGNTATYTLSQKFAIVNSVSTDRFGVPTQLIRLYEVGPNKERWPIPVTETTTVAATTPPEGWYTKASIQGGWSPQPSSPGGIILALPWLKHGKTQAIENTRWAFITPAARLNDKEITLGIFPVSVNLGTFRYQPFSDLWVSPFVGIDPKTRNTQIGGAISVTF